MTPRLCVRLLKTLALRLHNQSVEMDIEQFLTRKNIKLTANRILVTRQLAGASRPLSLGDLEVALDYSMDKASIFRVLELFAAKHVVHVIEDGSKAVKYELCQNDSVHSITDQHVHFYCERCKETFCLTTVKVPLISTPEGFSTHSVNYMIKGICPTCKE